MGAAKMDEKAVHAAGRYEEREAVLDFSLLPPRKQPTTRTTTTTRTMKNPPIAATIQVLT
jgi:hypothetical protein